MMKLLFYFRKVVEGFFFFLKVRINAFFKQLSYKPLDRFVFLINLYTSILKLKSDVI